MIEGLFLPYLYQVAIVLNKYLYINEGIEWNVEPTIFGRVGSAQNGPSILVLAYSKKIFFVCLGLRDY